VIVNRRALPAALVLAVVASASIGAQDLFRSNAAAIAVARISPAERSNYEYVLEVERDDGVRERTLFRDGERVRLERMRVDVRGRVLEEEHYERGVLREVRRFDERGRVREELDYDESGLLTERIEMVYNGGVRVAERHFDPEGELLFIDRFSYDSGGRIRRVERERDDAVVRSTSYAYADGRIFEEAFRSGDAATVVRYDELGRVAYRAERQDGRLIEEQAYRYETPDTRIVTTEGSDEPGVRIERFVDGRLAAVSVEIDGEVVSRSTREYADGRLVRVVTEGRDIAGRRVERYRYDDGELVRRVVQENDRIVREVLYTGPREREEITYRDGEPFLRVRYRDDNPVARELIRGE
jgi:hypothetical protein